MEKIGKVLEVFSAKVDDKISLPRPVVSELDCIENFGIKYDKFAGKDVDKSVMIVGEESYFLAEANGIDLKRGSLGENILLDFDPHKYQYGDILIIDEVELEITQNCTTCKHLNIFDKSLVGLLKNRRGLYCKIVKDGKIYKNSEVFIKKRG